MLLALTLTSCGRATYEYQGYERYTQGDITFKEGYRILQLTDSHWGVGSQFELEEAYISKLINDSKPNMIVLDGDMFMHANQRIVDRFFDFIDTFNIPFSYTYGNHDLQGFYRSDYIDQKVKSCKNSLLVNLDDGLTGNSNYYINLTDEATNKVIWQIIVMDSNNYINTDQYDVFHEDQISWYESIVNDTTAKNGGVVVPSLAFYHIPGIYFEEAWDEYLLSQGDNFVIENGYAVDGADTKGDGSPSGDRREDVCYGYKDDGIYDKIVELQSTKGIFVGHDHINNYHIKTPDDVWLCYNLKCGQNIYNEDQLLGGQVVDLTSDGNFKVTRIYQNYDGLGGN